MNVRATLMSRSIKSVTVECDGPKGRVWKTFDGPNAVSASRRFYGTKLKSGKNPRVVGADR